jgi:acyl-CoA dehydrogenase
MGVVVGSEVELLYRAVRPLRIYEGATEIQKLIIAKGLLDRAAAETPDKPQAPP